MRQRYRVLAILALSLPSGCAATDDRAGDPPAPLGHHRTPDDPGAKPVRAGHAPTRFLHGLVARASGGRLEGDAPVVILAHSSEEAPPPAPRTIALRLLRIPDIQPFFVAAVGQLIRFENDDGLFHNIFSASKENGFQSGPIQPGESREVRFQHPGLVELYCSLHKGKKASLLIVPTPHFAVANANGEFDFDRMPPGDYVVETWRKGCVLDRVEIEIVAGGPRFIRIVVPDRIPRDH